MESALFSLAAIYFAHSANFNNFRQKIPYLTRRDKRESYLIVLQKKMFRYAKDVRLASFLALTCSLRLSLHWLSLALTGSLPVSLWLWLSVTPTLALTALSGIL